ncbi:MAG: AI-2E family transporter [Bdellovibrionaceae bacterium]|nr:AI-2E family transporter [Bdellovibrio sp.]
MNTKKEKSQKILRIILLGTLVILFLAIFTPFAIPILLAAFVAFGSEPLIKKIRYKTKKRKLFSFGLIVTLLVILIVPLVLFTLRIANGLKSLSSESMQNSQFFQSLFTLWDKVQSYSSGALNTLGLNLDIIPQKEEIFSRLSPILLNAATQFLTALPDLVLSLFVFFCMLSILIINAPQIRNYFFNSEVLPADELEEVVKTFQSSCHMILVSTMLIGALQAFIVAVGSAIFGYQEFFLIFAVTFFLSFIPVIGAAPVAIVLSLLSFLMNNNGNGIGLLVVGIIAGTIDNILKPFIYSSSEENLNPVVSLLGIIGAIIVFGLPGLLLGPLILQVSTKLVPLLSKKLFMQPKSSE